MSSFPGEDRDQLRTESSTPRGYSNISSLESPTTEKPTRISYRECLKNHAATIGGNVTDGCGEFMPAGEGGTLEALKCAACNCHRNFHRKEMHGGDPGGSAVVHPLHLPPQMVHHRGGHWSSMVQPVKMAAAGGTDSSSEERNFNAYRHHPINAPPRKRFRTKFTAEQKEKMMEFAEKVGWRIPREDDAEVQRFCAEVGVTRNVFKVWMHNNKITSSKKNNPQEF